MHVYIHFKKLNTQQLMHKRYAFTFVFKKY